MRRLRAVARRDGRGVSSLLDAVFLVLVLTVALVGTWAYSVTSDSRSTTQYNEYNLRYASLGLNRWLGATVPVVVLKDPQGQVVELRDQKVLDLLSIELVFLRQGASLGGFEGLHTTLKGILDDMVLPEHDYSAAATDTSAAAGGAGRTGNVGTFLLVSSGPGTTSDGWEATFTGDGTFTAQLAYPVPKGFGGAEGASAPQLTVALACWAA